jgi:mycofactocin system glycosyltransferase
VKDRPALLERCLTGLGTRYPVLVVDDGSADPAAVDRIAARHGARVIHRACSGGPAAARNTGLAVLVESELVALLDSDCEVAGDWIAALAGHFVDPAVAAVAPRVLPQPATTRAGRFAQWHNSLDLGERAARVRPGSRVSYLPTAALVVRRSALASVDPTGARVFDPALRYGEDVDLVWRLHEAGWRIRYEPGVIVRHKEPDSWPALLSRRYRYGTSAAPLAARHPGTLAPLVLQPLPTLSVLALLARRPLPAVAAYLLAVRGIRNTLREAGLPITGVAGPAAGGVRQTWQGIGRYGSQFAMPVLAAGLLGRRTRWPALSLLAGPAILDWLGFDSRPGLPRYLAGRCADDLAYGAGVWAGALRERVAEPLLPRIAWRPFRIRPR